MDPANEPAPGAPATEPAATPPAPGAPATTQPNGQPTGQPPEDITSLPEWAQKQIRDLRGEATKARTTAKQTAAQEARDQLTQQLAKVLGIGGETEVTAEDLAGQIEQYQFAAFRSAVELGVYRTAAEFGVDPELLLDSNRFIDSLDDILDVDPNSSEFKDQLKAKVQEAAATGRYKGQAPTTSSTTSSTTSGAPRPDPSQGTRGPAVHRPTSLGEAVAQHLAAQRR